SIEDGIDNLHLNESERNTLISGMQKSFYKTQLSDEQFTWLDKGDERFCNWVWCFIREIDRLSNRRRSHIETEMINLSTKDLIDTRNSYQQRRKDIISCFHNSEAYPEQQQHLINQIQSIWQTIFQDKRVLNWLDKNNPKQWQWAWEYILNFDKNLISFIWPPTSDNEIKSAIVSIFDMFDILHDNPDRKTLLIGNMKRAWSQKKFRDKNEGKKAYSISMTEKTKQKLDSLAEHKGMKINETIEILIKNEFEKLKI
ncbi:hypothetical protein CAG70_00285, partial [Photobacterium halotolerans]|uniref:hypothetical protein n=1 Tax=Photobacterium halotolerans TaxID=265726 RepID=UPI0013723CE6